MKLEPVLLRSSITLDDYFDESGLCHSFLSHFGWIFQVKIFTHVIILWFQLIPNLVFRQYLFKKIELVSISDIYLMSVITWDDVEIEMSHQNSHSVSNGGVSAADKWVVDGVGGDCGYWVQAYVHIINAIGSLVYLDYALSSLVMTRIVITLLNDSIQATYTLTSRGCKQQKCACSGMSWGIRLKMSTLWGAFEWRH